jgi:3-hydroxyisobutyrate dehydrogenase-like beta-hydroxyacid dehydrogenase
MGLPICKRLKAGHDVTALARRPSQAETFASHGLASTGTIADTIKNADVVFTSVTDDAALSEVALNPAFAAALKPGAVFIDISTVSPAKRAIDLGSAAAIAAIWLGEALAFGKKGGLTDQAMLEVITQSVVASPLISYKKDMIISSDYSPAATLDMLKKDLDLLLTTADRQQTHLPLSSMIRDIYAAASDRDLGERDFFILVQEAANTKSE